MNFQSAIEKEEKNTIMAMARGSGDSSNDIQLDAVPVSEDIPLEPSSEDTEYDPDLFSKRRGQQETAVKTGERTVSGSEKSNDNNIIDYIPYLPPELKYDGFDILILNAEGDEDGAFSLKEGIDKNVVFCGKLKPNVTLLKDVIPIQKDGDHLDDAFKRTLYVVLYVTEEFCKQSLYLFQSHSCLKRALTSKDEKWSIIPVHTSPKNSRNYELPLMLDGLRPLNLFSASFYQDVKKLLEHKSNVILERRANLAEKRQEYVDVNWKKLDKFRWLNIETEHVMVPTQKKFENSSDLHKNISVSTSESQNRTSAAAQEQCKSLQQKCGMMTNTNTDPLQQQQQEEQMNQDVILNTEEMLHMKKSHFGPKSHSSSITTDSPFNEEISEEYSEKDSLDHSKQMGLPSEFDCNKNCYSSSAKISTVKYSSLPEPADDKAIPEDLTPYALTGTESDLSHIGSHINFSTGQRNTYSHPIVSEDGSHPYINVGEQRVLNNREPNVPAMFSSNPSGASPNNPGREVPLSRSSRNRASENTSMTSGSQVTSGPEVHIHIYQATNVAIGRHSQINVGPVVSRNEDTSNSEDSENEQAYEI